MTNNFSQDPVVLSRTGYSGPHPTLEGAYVYTDTADSGDSGDKWIAVPALAGLDLYSQVNRKIVEDHLDKINADYLHYDAHIIGPGVAMVWACESTPASLELLESVLYSLADYPLLSDYDYSELVEELTEEAVDALLPQLSSTLDTDIEPTTVYAIIREAQNQGIEVVRDDGYQITLDEEFIEDALRVALGIEVEV